MKSIKEKEELSGKEKEVEDLKEIVKGLEKRVSELTTEIAKANDSKVKLELELSETSKKCADFEEKCSGLFDQAIHLNVKVLEYEDEIKWWKWTAENLSAQVAEKEAMMVIRMRDSVSLFSIQHTTTQQRQLKS